MDFQLFVIINNLAGKSELFDYLIIFFASALIFILAFASVSVVFSRWNSGGQESFFDLIIGVCASLFINWSIYLFYFRPRPFVDFQVVKMIDKSGLSKSFPSDHSAISFALATAVFILNKKWGIFCYFLALLIGFGRIATGIHYPSDIVAGAVIGAISALLVKRLLDEILKRNKVIAKKDIKADESADRESALQENGS